MRIHRYLLIGLLCLVLTTTSLQSAHANYETKSQLILKFKSLCDQHPSQTDYWSIGKTVYGNEIWMFFFGNSNGRRILLEAQVHGSEDLGSEMLYLMAKWLFTDDSDAQYIRSNCAVYLVPVMNFDSYGRKNARGVDLYYNFPTDFGGGSGYRYSDEYRGPYALSEPESRTMHNVFSNYRFRYYLSIHQGGGPYLAPYRYMSSTAVNTLKSRISQESSQRGVTPYPYDTAGDPGSEIRDAYAHGIRAWLLEANGYPYRPDSWNIPYYYRRALPILIAMAYA